MSKALDGMFGIKRLFFNEEEQQLHPAVEFVGEGGTVSEREATDIDGKRFKITQITVPGGAPGEPGEPGEPGAPGADGAQGPPGLGINYRVPRTTAKLRITTNVNLANTSTTVDGVSHPGSTVTGHTFYLTGQTNPTENNRLYRATSLGGGAMSLTEITTLDAVMATGPGLRIGIREGTANGGKWFTLDASHVSTEIEPLGLSVTDLDVEDFWIPADGTDYANAFDRAAYAMQLNICMGVIRFQRQSSYYKSRYNHIGVGFKVAGRGGAYAGNSTFIDCAKGGFIIASADAGTTAAGAEISNLVLRGSGWNQAKDWTGVEAHQAPILRNMYCLEFPGNGVILRGKTADGRNEILAAAITTTADFVVPTHGETVQVQFSSTTALREGTPIYIATAGLYKVISVDSPTLATCLNYGSTLPTAYQAASAAAGATIASGKAITGCYSNVDHASLYDVRCTSNGLDGFLIYDDNANQVQFYSCDATDNGKRAIRSKNYGFHDRTFLGNHYFGCHSRDNTWDALVGATTTATFVQPAATGALTDLNAPNNAPFTVTITVDTTANLAAGAIVKLGSGGGSTGYYYVVSVTNGTQFRANLLQALNGGTIGAVGATVATGKVLAFVAAGYLATSNNARSTYIGCYNENNDVSILSAFCSALSGHMNNLISGRQFAAQSGGYVATGPIQVGQQGLFQTTWATGGTGTDVIERFTSSQYDTSGYDFKMPSSSLAPTAGGMFAWEHAGLATKRAAYLTLAGFTGYGPGYLGSARFILGRAASRIDFCSSLAGTVPPPTNSTALDFLNVGMVGFFYDRCGPWAYRNTAKVVNSTSSRVVGQVCANDDPAVLGDATGTLQPQPNAALVGGDGYHHQIVTATPQTANHTTTLGITNVYPGALWQFEHIATPNRFTRAFLSGGSGTPALITMPGGCNWKVLFRYDGVAAQWTLIEAQTWGHVRATGTYTSAHSSVAVGAGVTVTPAGGTLTGIVAGDALEVTASNTIPAGVLFQAVATGNDTFELRAFNAYGAGAVDLSAVAWIVRKAA